MLFLRRSLLLAALLVSLLCPGPAAGQDCAGGVAGGPSVLWDSWPGPLFLWGTTPVVTVVETEVWTTPPAGGAPAAVSTVGPQLV